MPAQQSQTPRHPPILIGLSGPSSSGKTTIARLLRNLLPLRTLILHQDDFYRAEEELPFRAGHRDWDCAEAIDLEGFTAALAYIRKRGHIPPDLDSKEDQNDVGPSPVSDTEVERLKGEMQQWLQQERPDLLSAREKEAESQSSEADSSNQYPAQVVIVDGFLLFGRSVSQVRSAFDLRLLLRARYADAKARREQRSGYVTLEGFWEDPPGYVDDVVWPGYVEEHAFLFKSGDVDGEVDQRVAEELGIHICPGEGDMEMAKMLEWVLRQLKATLKLETSA
jgi:nicotinamide/nicotinate riboside kinase